MQNTSFERKKIHGECVFGDIAAETDDEKEEKKRDGERKEEQLT